MISHPEVVQVWKQVQHKMFQPLSALRCGLELRAMKEQEDAEVGVMLAQIDRVSTLGHFAEDLVIDAQEMKISQDLASVLREAAEIAKQAVRSEHSDIAAFYQSCAVVAGPRALSGSLIEVLSWSLQHSEDQRIGLELHASDTFASLRINGVRLNAWQSQHAFELFTSEQRTDAPELWNRPLVRARCLFQSLGGDIELIRAHAHEQHTISGRIPLASEKD
jgi:hypothetical protein